MPSIKDFSLSELEEFATSMGMPSYRGRQMFEWLYKHHVENWSDISNVPRDFIDACAEVGPLSPLSHAKEQTSTDGTVKLLFTLQSGRHIESVLIPEFDDDGALKRSTICVSSQVGCAMSCSFCATGLMGFHQNLTAGEIVEQVLIMSSRSQEMYGRRATNIVFMGMGEPMLNYGNVVKAIDILTHKPGFEMSPRRITVSTVGLAKGIERLAVEQPKVRLAVSLHAPTDSQRSAIMPVNRQAKTDLSALKQAIQTYHSKSKNMVMYEYCMFRGVNDSLQDAKNLIGVTRWAPSKVNLIMYNPVEGLGFERTTEKQLDQFIACLASAGVRVTVRRSRGQDIDAACGQLATTE